ncbi:MAG: hypothetical protein AAF720_05765 [Pseudomonadota bacterium]
MNFSIRGLRFFSAATALAVTMVACDHEKAVANDSQPSNQTSLSAPSQSNSFSLDAIERDLKLLDSVEHLRSGGAGELSLSNTVAARLQAFGFEVERQAFDAPFFDAQTTMLRWDDGEVDVFPQYIVVPTGKEGVTAPMHLWRLGDDPAELKAKIALIVLPRMRHSALFNRPARETLDAALEGEPAAVVIITTGPTGETIMLNAPSDAPYADIPIAVLGPKPGASAMAAAKQGRTGTLIIDGEGGRRPSHNLVARRRGEGKTVVVSTPRSGWTPGVGERGPGFAAFLALAEWASQALPNQNLLFVSTTAHEFRHAGSKYFMDSDLAPSPDDVKIWLHLGAGFAGRAYHDIGGLRAADYFVVGLKTVDTNRYLAGSMSLLPLLRERFAGQPALENAYPASLGAEGELKEVLSKGYKPAFGLFGSNVRHHLMSDRISEVDPKWVQDAAMSAKDVISAIVQKDD